MTARKAAGGRRRGNGEGTIIQRKDGRWCAVLTLDDGKRRTLYGKTRAEAAAKLTAALAAKAAGDPLTPLRAAGEPLTLGSCVADWLTSVRPAMRPSTWSGYSATARRYVIGEPVARTPLAKLTPTALRLHYAALIARPLAPSTVQLAHCVIRGALKAAVADRVIARSIADAVRPPRAARPEMHVLDAEQVRRLLDAARGHRLEAIYTLAVTTGMRRGEMLGLHWRDVDLDAAHLRVVSTIVRVEDSALALGEPKTAKSRRRVDLSAAAVEALRAHRGRQLEERVLHASRWVDQDLVFPNTSGGLLQPAVVSRDAQEAILARAGLDRVRFHDLRHTAATLLMERGIHVKAVSELLGHSSTAITLDTYSHVTPAMSRGAASAMDTMLAGG